MKVEHWCEGLDWINVWNLVGDDGAYGEAYTNALEHTLDALEDENPRRARRIVAEAKRRAKAGKISRDQVECIAAALKRIAERAKRDVDLLTKLVRKANLKVVK